MGLDQHKVTQICLEYVPSYGGSAWSVRDFNRAFESSIIAFTSAGNKNRLQEWNTQVCRIPIRSGFLGRKYALPALSEDLQKARLMLDQSNLIIIHLLYRYHFQWAGALARQMRIPYWIVPHGGLDPYVFTYRTVPKKLWLMVLGSPVMRHAQAVIFATEREREKALPYVHGCQTKVIHWPVDPVDTSGRAQARERVRSRHQIPDDARVLLWMGRLHFMKRPLQTTEALGKAGRQDIHLLLVGPDGDMTRQDCERICVEKGIRNVHVVGPVYGSEKYDFYLAADAYISLSLKENFNYALAEAMASGLPLIISPGNDLSPELQSIKCGWIQRTNDIHESIASIRQFASISQIELDDMGSVAQQWARIAFSRETFVQTVRQLAAGMDD